jgi:hypothetical protein
VEVNMFQHLETLNHAVSSIEHPYEEPNFVFMPDAFHDKNPFKIYTSDFSMAKLFLYLLLLPFGVVLREVLSEHFFCTLSANTHRFE